MKKKTEREIIITPTHPLSFSLRLFSFCVYLLLSNTYLPNNFGWFLKSQAVKITTHLITTKSYIGNIYKYFLCKIMKNYKKKKNHVYFI